MLVHMKKLIPIVAAAFVFVGCDDADNDFDLDNNTEDAFEETGEALEEGAENTGEALEDAAEDTRDGFKELGDDIDDKVDVDVD